MKEERDIIYKEIELESLFAMPLSLLYSQWSNIPYSRQRKPKLSIIFGTMPGELEKEVIKGELGIWIIKPEEEFKLKYKIKKLFSYYKSAVKVRIEFIDRLEKIKELKLFKTFPKIKYIRALPSPTGNRWIEFGYERYRCTLESELLMLVNSLISEYAKAIEQGGVLDSFTINDLIYQLKKVRSLSYVSEEEKKDAVNKIGGLLARSYMNKAKKENLTASDMIRVFAVSNLDECKENENVINIVNSIKNKYYRGISFYRKKWEQIRKDCEEDEKFTIEEAEEFIKRKKELNYYLASEQMPLSAKRKKRLAIDLEKIDLLHIEDLISI